MFKLYSNNKGLKLLDISKDEKDIKETLGEFMELYDTVNYIVTESTMYGENTIATIRNYGDYVDYICPVKTITKHFKI